MNLSAPFIARPIGTALIALGVVLAGVLAYFALPVAPLPQVDYPTINVSASLPGASAETMAATVATPLERTLGRIAGVTEITSNSSLGSTSITLQFDLDRKVNAAAREVQAAINAARPLLPSGMPNAPTYKKVNPADSPILILGLTSEHHTRGEMYDIASTLLSQVLSQVKGVGQVSIGGGALPAVRVDIDPNRTGAQGLSLNAIRSAIVQSNTNRPAGVLEQGEQRWQIGLNSQARTAKEYESLVIRYQNQAAVQLGAVAQVSDSVQDVRAFGQVNDQPAVVLIVYKAPGANIIGTVDDIRSKLPVLQSLLPAAMNLRVVMDRTPTIRGSLWEVQFSLMVSIVLVLMVVLLFLRKWRAALIPSVAIPVSLAGTLGVMYLCGFSLDNLSLMALTVATGFVVDDAIVVQENIVRHLERGKSAMQAALEGAREIGFTVVSISISLVAVFIPVLFMGGIVGRFFWQFAVTLSAAIAVSLLVSLTLTPSMAAHILRPEPRSFQAPRALWLMRAYRHSLAWCLRHRVVILLVLLATIALNVYLYIHIAKGFFPQQDTGRVFGFVRVDQSASYQLTEQKTQRFIEILRKDPAVDTVVGFIGGGRRNSGFMFLTLKPLKERGASMTEVLGRLRPQLSKVPGATLSLVPAQDVRVGGRSSSAEFQFTLLGDDLDVLREWEGRVRVAMAALPELLDVSTDDADKGLQTELVIDRDAASRLGLSVRDIDTVLNNSFSQRQVSTIYNPLNQYRVVMGLSPEYLESPESLKQIRFINSSGQSIPLSSFARLEASNAPLSVSHDGGFPSSTISFSLAPGVSLNQATQAVLQAYEGLSPPSSLQGLFAGNARAFQSNMGNQPLLILAAILAIYIVLGMLYESLLHPLTILSTLPSAGVGALLALMAFDQEFGVIALIGVLLLIGIVKKNAIMMIDFAIEAQRTRGLSAAQAIYQAAALRLRPILMTTLAAMLGALPLALGSGDGAELRVPLGISIVGGLLFSQLLTLYTTPVVYVGLDRLKTRFLGSRVEPALMSPTRQAAP